MVSCGSPEIRVGLSVRFPMPVFDAVGTATELIKDYRDYACVHMVMPEEPAIRIERTVHFIDIALLYSAGLNILSPILGHVHPHFGYPPESQCIAADAIRQSKAERRRACGLDAVAMPTKPTVIRNP